MTAVLSDAEVETLFSDGLARVREPDLTAMYEDIDAVEHREACAIKRALREGGMRSPRLFRQIKSLRKAAAEIEKSL